MEKETLNLLIGTGLGFFLSVLLSIINNSLQRNKDAQERSYQIFLERINQLEEFSKKIMATLSKMSVIFRAKYATSTAQEKEKYLEEIMDEITDFIPQYGYYSGISHYLGGNIERIFGDLLAKPHQLFANLSELHSVILLDETENENDFMRKIIDEPRYVEKIVSETEYIEIYTNLLSAFDKLKSSSTKNLIK